MQKPLLALLPITLFAILIAGCYTAGKSKEIDPAIGYIPTTSAAAASVVKSEKIDIAKYRPLILTLGGAFFKEQTIQYGYFTTVVDAHDMEKLLIQENKADIAFDIANPVSWKRIADNYKPFLVLQMDERTNDGKRYIQLKAAQADTGSEVFVAEVNITSFKGVMIGANDKNVYYPLYNAFIKWIKSNE